MGSKVTVITNEKYKNSTDKTKKKIPNFVLKKLKILNVLKISALKESNKNCPKKSKKNI